MNLSSSLESMVPNREGIMPLIEPGKYKVVDNKFLSLETLLTSGYKFQSKPLYSEWAIPNDKIEYLEKCDDCDEFDLYRAECRKIKYL